MTPPVSFTLDLEDLRTSADQELRFPTVTLRILDLLAAHDVRASVYVVGELVDDHPGLIRRIAADGHELGLHSWRHVPIALLGPDELRADLLRGRDRLQQLSGQPIDGYRAPMMSLVPDTSWAVDVVAEAGFEYSSSVLPAPSPMFGWPGLPRRPFRWSNGLLELPCPVVTVGGVAVPFLGGTYLRILPAALRRIGVRRSGPDEVLWTYCHPWEFDPAEPFYRYAHASWLTSRVGWLNRRGMLRRVRRVIAGGAGPPLGEVAKRLATDANLPVVDIDEAARAQVPAGVAFASRWVRDDTAELAR